MPFVAFANANPVGSIQPERTHKRCEIRFFSTISLNWIIKTHWKFNDKTKSNLFYWIALCRCSREWEIWYPLLESPYFCHWYCWDSVDSNDRCHWKIILLLISYLIRLELMKNNLKINIFLFKAQKKSTFLYRKIERVPPPFRLCMDNCMGKNLAISSRLVLRQRHSKYLYRTEMGHMTLTLILPMQRNQLWVWIRIYQSFFFSCFKNWNSNR